MPDTPFERLRCSADVGGPGEESYDSSITKAAHTPVRQVETDLVLETSGHSG